MNTAVLDHAQTYEQARGKPVPSHNHTIVQTNPAINPITTRQPPAIDGAGDLLATSSPAPPDQPPPLTSRSPAPSPDPKLIFIPPEFQLQPLYKLPLSVRLQNILSNKDYSFLGDLHGVAYAELRHVRNLGPKSILELSQFVAAIQRGELRLVEPQTQAQPASVTHLDTLDIPDQAHALNPFELPLSVRLKSALQGKGIQQLGDLHAMPLNDLSRLRNCGRKTMAELVRLIERVAAGEFPVPPQEGPEGSVSFSPSQGAELVRRLDVLLEKIPPRNRQIFLLRLGINGSPSLTLAEVGRQFHLTRERVRQIEIKVIARLRKEGGPHLTAQLDGIAAWCADQVLPITPALLAQWLGAGAPLLRPLLVYARFLNTLHPLIPFWDGESCPHGGDPEIVSHLEQILRAEAQGLSLKTAFDLLKKRAPMCQLTIFDYFSALKRSQLFRVDLTQHSHPIVCLCRLSIEAVAKDILAASPSPLSPERILAQARLKFGSKLVPWKPPALEVSLTPAKGFLIDQGSLVERVIRRAEPPLTFNRLCELFEIPNSGELAERLWQVCSSLDTVLRIPETCSPGTRVVPRSCSLAQALAATAKALNRPLQIHGIQWHLHALFGPLFTRMSVAEIRRCLERSPLFLRQADDAYRLAVKARPQ